MARANIADVRIGPNAAEPAGTALTVADGGQFPIAGDGSEILRLTASAAATVTVPSVCTADGSENLFTRKVTLAAGETRYVRLDGSFVQRDGMARVNVSAAGVTALVLRPAFVDIGYAA
ncbi:hypothetical protein [Actinomadura sp. RB99]|uniref:hypothetical protein n=1 Tax=Actinomadura sp. RB99 TaxID=2691577 RepID=UPI0016829591|nr:hypothetical protein [Actinomadura sp. RB99]